METSVKGFLMAIMKLVPFEDTRIFGGFTTIWGLLEVPWLYRQRCHGEFAFATTGGHENSIVRPNSGKIVRVGFGAGTVDDVISFACSTLVGSRGDSSRRGVCLVFELWHSTQMLGKIRRR